MINVIWLHLIFAELHKSFVTDIYGSRRVFRKCPVRNLAEQRLLGLTVYVFFLSPTTKPQRIVLNKRLPLLSKSFPIHNLLTLCRSKFLPNASQFSKEHCFLEGFRLRPFVLMVRETCKWWVSKSRAARLYHAACGQVCKLCTFYKNHTIIEAVRCTVYCCYATCGTRGCFP